MRYYLLLLCLTIFGVTRTLQREERFSAEMSTEDEIYVEKSEANKERRNFRDIKTLMVPQQNMDMLGTFDTKPIITDNFINEESSPNTWTRNIGLHTSKLSAYVNINKVYKDPLWSNQWFMQDYRTSMGPVMDHNIVPAHRMGYTGEGIQLSVIGEGIVDLNLDMHDQFVVLVATVGGVGTGRVLNLDLFYDAIEVKHTWTGVKYAEKLNWMPSLSTKMASVIAMKANNSMCGVGVAYDTKISAIKVNVVGEYRPGNLAAGLYQMRDKIDVFVDAVDRMDNGKTFTFSQEVRKAFQAITYRGRKSKGSIFVTGAGDGKSYNDYCGADDIVNSMHTFVIASANQLGHLTSYSEKCPGVLATAYSSDIHDEHPSDVYEKIVAIDTDGTCSQCFGGNEASIAIASGIIALTLQANPQLTWRDVMHVVATSSEVAPLAYNHGWKLNRAGFYVSHSFGFGLLNAENMVIAAKKWTNVPKMSSCRLKFNIRKEFAQLKVGYHVTFSADAKDCEPTEPGDSIPRYIEQVELVTTLTHSYRGALTIKIAAPRISSRIKTTESTMLHERLRDTSFKGLRNWSIKSLHFWGENPDGIWTLLIYNANTSIGGNYVRNAKLLIHGTTTQPEHYKDRPHNKLRTYSDVIPMKYKHA